MANDPKNPTTTTTVEGKEAGIIISAAETVAVPAPAPTNGATAPATPAPTAIAAPAKPAEKLTFLAKVGKFGDVAITRRDVAIAAGVVGVVVVGLEVTHRYVPKCPAVFGILEKKNPTATKK